MREKLARAAAKAYGDYEQGFGRVDDLWGSQVDAILREMMEPTDEMMLEALIQLPEYDQPTNHDIECAWKAMLQHILDEPRDTKDDAA